MGDLPISVDDFDLVDRVDGRRQASVDAKDLVVDDYTESQEVEHVGEIMPDVGVAVFSGALCVKAVGLGDAS